MAIKINFDPSRVPETPTLLLANRNGEKLGQLPAKNIVLKDSLNNAAEISFCIYKYTNGEAEPLWDKIINSRLVWCKEWDVWFELTTDIDESDKTVKNVSCVQLAQAELSQVNLYNIEINTENDIAREDYFATVLFNSQNKKASLLHRIMEKAPHYSVIHVDSTIKNIQRTFTFDGTSLYDAFQQIAEEIGCLFRFHSGTNENGTIERAISVYDLQSNCLKKDDSGILNCRHRGEFTGKCPKCGSTDISEGFGEDTAIFITTDELADEIQFTTDSGSVKNCFKLEAGDDLMTATVRNCNPNGSDYIWHISDDMKKIMSDGLVTKLTDYDKMYAYFQNEYTIDLNKYSLLNHGKIEYFSPAAAASTTETILFRKGSYNAIADKYKMPLLSSSVTGYPALMTAYYNTIDLELHLRSSMMPEVIIKKPDASEQVTELIKHFEKNAVPVAVSDTRDITNVSDATIKSAVLAMAKVIVDSRFKIEIKTAQELNDNTWKFTFTITSYTDKEDTADSPAITIHLCVDQETYLLQSIEKMLNKDYKDDFGITSLFQESVNNFTEKLAEYCLNRLTSFYDACEACIELLKNRGLDDESSGLHSKLYVPYTEKLKAIQEEKTIRQNELNVVTGLQDCIRTEQESIQDELNFEAFIKKNNGDLLWTEFCSYRREDKYSNSNYISDGLTNAELFKRAQEFIETANNELYKSAELQHSISASLKNLLVMKKFEPLVEHFEVGNWVRAQVDDKIYKLRMMEYEINYEELDKISVSFSDVMRLADGVSDMKSILEQTAHMTKSYSSLQRQANQSAKNTSLVQNWVEKGLDATNIKIMNSAENQTQIWDEHGMLFREYDPVTDDYLDNQLKIVNSTIAITDDNWKTTKTALGLFYYPNPENQGRLLHSYGINGETLVGKLILGENLGIYNKESSLKFDKNGLCITSPDKNRTFTVNPNDEKLLNLSTEKGDIFYVNSDGTLHLKGNGAELNLADNKSVKMAWNNISKYIQFENSELRIYEKETGLADDLLMKLTYTGNWYYYNGRTVGKIGTAGWGNDDDYRGLIFGLQHGADYMCWGYQEEENNNYITHLLYCANEKKSAYGLHKGLHLGCTTYCSGNLYINDNIHTINYSDGSGGWYSDTAPVSLHGTTARMEGGSSTVFACNSDKYIFYKSELNLVECFNNIDLKNYGLLNQSDVRLKTNITDTSVNALGIINQIQLKEFDWIENGAHEEIGMIAQQLQTILPDLVYEDASTGKLSIKINKFIPYLMKAIQELSASPSAYSLSRNTYNSPARIQKADGWTDEYTLEEKEAFTETVKAPVLEKQEMVTAEPIIIPNNQKK